MLGQILSLKRMVNDPPVGAIGGLLSNDPGDGLLVMQEAFWFVHPDARGGGLYLLSEFERLARDVGASRIIVGHLSSNPRVAIVYRRRGYRELETFFGKELTT
jgi:GNAT superfamily N-acetyltransferase